MPEQFVSILVGGVLVGIGIFVMMILIKRGNAFAAKRNKTTLGLIKIAGTGIKRDGEAADDIIDIPVDDIPKTDSDSNDDAEFTGDVNTNCDDAGTQVPDDIDANADDDGADTGVDDDNVSNVDKDAIKTDIASDDTGEQTDSEQESESCAIPAKEVNETEDGVNAPIPADDTDTFAQKIQDLTVKKRRVPDTVRMKDRKVLVAEDVQINRELIDAFFDGSGVKLDFAENGLEVCEKFEEDHGNYSLILMDVQMPVMNGYDATRRIRAMDIDWAKQIPIIAMTGNTFKEDIDMCFDAGMDDHLSKPINAESLQNKVFDFIAMSVD